MSGQVASFRGTIFAQGYDLRLGGGGHNGILGCESRFLPTDSGVKTKKSLGRNLSLRRNFFLEFGSEDQKKDLRSEIYAFVMTLTRVFVLEQKFLTLGGHKQHFRGAQDPKRTPMAPGLLLYFLVHNPCLGEHISCLGAQAVIWGSKAPKCHPPPCLIGVKRSKLLG